MSDKQLIDFAHLTHFEPLLTVLQSNSMKQRTIVETTTYQQCSDFM